MAIIQNLFKRRKPSEWTNIGEGIDLDDPDRIIKIGLPEGDRKGHFW